MTYSKADRLCEAQCERSNQRHHESFVCRHTCGIQLRLAFQLVVSGELTKTARAAIEDVGRTCLESKIWLDRLLK